MSAPDARSGLAAVLHRAWSRSFVAACVTALLGLVAVVDYVTGPMPPSTSVAPSGRG